MSLPDRSAPLFVSMAAAVASIDSLVQCSIARLCGIGLEHSVGRQSLDLCQDCRCASRRLVWRLVVQRFRAVPVLHHVQIMFALQLRGAGRSVGLTNDLWLPCGIFF